MTAVTGWWRALSIRRPRCSELIKIGTKRPQVNGRTQRKAVRGRAATAGRRGPTPRIRSPAAAKIPAWLGNFCHLRVS